VTFKVQNLSVDLLKNTANFMAFDEGYVIQGSFPFTPNGGDGREHDKVLAAAKAALQKCLNEI
jgi:hypothetical protein